MQVLTWNRSLVKAMRVSLQPSMLHRTLASCLPAASFQRSVCPSNALGMTSGYSLRMSSSDMRRDLLPLLSDASSLARSSGERDARMLLSSASEGRTDALGFAMAASRRKRNGPPTRPAHRDRQRATIIRWNWSACRVSGAASPADTTKHKNSPPEPQPRPGIIGANWLFRSGAVSRAKTPSSTPSSTKGAYTDSDQAGIIKRNWHARREGTRDTQLSSILWE